jgi:DNA polymerase IV
VNEQAENRVRRIAHLDMDAFYASVELLRYPQLKGLPVVIGGSRRAIGQPHGTAPEFARLRNYAGRGVVTTATYAAREFGIHSAMGLMQAARLCPDAILLPVDFDQYRHYSRQFKAVIAASCPVIEDRGIDEVFIDFSEVPGAQADGGRALAARLQTQILEATGLTCSIGVAPNKLLAKLASELQKPKGISVLYEADLEAQIWPLPCRRINGVGPKAQAKLERAGLHLIGDLARCDRQLLREQFGRTYGQWLHASAWGWDDRPVVTSSEPVSISRETTFDRDLHAVRDRAELRQLFTTLCRQLAEDLQKKGYLGRTIGIKLRFDDFSRLTRDHSIERHTADAILIRHVAGQCLKRAPLERPLRLLGVKISNLIRCDATFKPSGEHNGSEDANPTPDMF